MTPLPLYYTVLEMHLILYFSPGFRRHRSGASSCNSCFIVMGIIFEILKVKHIICLTFSQCNLLVTSTPGMSSYISTEDMKTDRFSQRSRTGISTGTTVIINIDNHIWRKRIRVIMLMSVHIPTAIRAHRISLPWKRGCMRYDMPVWTRMYNVPGPKVSPAPKRWMDIISVFWKNRKKHYTDSFREKILNRQIVRIKSVCFTWKLATTHIPTVLKMPIRRPV